MFTHCGLYFTYCIDERNFMFLFDFFFWGGGLLLKETLINTRVGYVVDAIYGVSIIIGNPTYSFFSVCHVSVPYTSSNLP